MCQRLAKIYRETNKNTDQHKYKHKSAQIQIPIEDQPGRPKPSWQRGAPPITDGGTMKGGGGRTYTRAVFTLHDVFVQ